MTQNKWNWASPNDPIKWLRQAVKNIIEISSLQALPVIPTHDGPKSKTYCTMPYQGKKKKNSSCLIPNCTYDGDLEEIRTLNRKNGCITWTTINNMQRHIYNTLYLTAATCSQPSCNGRFVRTVHFFVFSLLLSTIHCASITSKMLHITESKTRQSFHYQHFSCTQSQLVIHKRTTLWSHLSKSKNREGHYILGMPQTAKMTKIDIVK